MKWNLNDLNLYPIPEESKSILATEGIDAESLLYPCELCNCFYFDENFTCIGSITGKFLLIDNFGKLILKDESDLIPIAESVSSFINTNNYLSKIDFSQKINWELVLCELDRENNVFLNSSFWREFIEFLYISHDMGTDKLS
jgi:hypothetical protein